MPLSWGMGDEDSRRGLLQDLFNLLWLFCRPKGQAPHVPHPATLSVGRFQCPSGLPLPAPPQPTHLRTLWLGWEEMCRKPLHKVSLTNSLSQVLRDCLKNHYFLWLITKWTWASELHAMKQNKTICNNCVLPLKINFVSHQTLLSKEAGKQKLDDDDK